MKSHNEIPRQKSFDFRTFNSIELNSISLPDCEELAETAALIQLQPSHVHSRNNHIENGHKDKAEDNNSFFFSLFPLHYQASFKKERDN